MYNSSEGLGCHNRTFHSGDLKCLWSCWFSSILQGDKKVKRSFLHYGIMFILHTCENLLHTYKDVEIDLNPSIVIERACGDIDPYPPPPPPVGRKQELERSFLCGILFIWQEFKNSNTRAKGVVKVCAYGVILHFERSSGSRVVKLLACRARGPGFDSRPRHLNFQRLVISCFQVEIWLKGR